MNGWDKFRDLESETLEIVLRDAHNTKTKRTIVACGGGIVETERSRKLLQRERHSTIYIRRHPDDVDSELNGHDEGGTALRPSYSGGESVRIVLEKMILSQYIHFKHNNNRYVKFRNVVILTTLL